MVVSFVFNFCKQLIIHWMITRSINQLWGTNNVQYFFSRKNRLPPTHRIPMYSPRSDYRNNIKNNKYTMNNFEFLHHLFISYLYTTCLCRVMCNTNDTHNIKTSSKAGIVHLSFQPIWCVCVCVCGKRYWNTFSKND